MSREIKFRVFDTKTKKMWFSDMGAFVAIENMKITPIDCILMQYTGLKDKNGKEIYEEDIVIGYQDEKSMLKVTYKEGCYDLYDESNFRTELYNVYSIIEVVGNIYESELL